MKSLSPRVLVLAVVATAFLLVPSSPVALADEVAAGGAASGLVVHGAQETLTRYCATDAEGRLWLEIPGGARFELITSVQDPAIANPGDGAFHAFDEAEVHRALTEVSYPLA